MRYLIDTQIIIWAISYPRKLSKNVKSILESNTILVSPISFLEIAIKQKIGKLPEFDLPIETLSYRLEQDGFNFLALETRHISAYDSIPLFAEHRDPFDRILLATCFNEDIPIISADTNFKLYMPQVQIVMNA